jgi:hypothetical protein
MSATPNGDTRNDKKRAIDNGEEEGTTSKYTELGETFMHFPMLLRDVRRERLFNLNVASS